MLIRQKKSDTVVFRLVAVTIYFLFPVASQQDLGPNQPFVLLLARPLFLGVKQSKREADFNLLPSLRVRGATLSFSHMPSWHAEE